MIGRRAVAGARWAAAFALTIPVGGCAPEPSRPGQAAESAEGPGLTGFLVDEAGDPLPFRNVMACTRAVCFYTDTNGDGRFTFVLDEPIRGVIKTEEDLRSKPRRSSPMIPVAIGSDDFLDVGDVVAPDLPAGAPIDPNVSETQTVDAGDGLSLTLSPAAIETAPGRVLDNIAARRLPKHAIPHYATLAGESIVAVYALHPFAAESAGPMGVRVDSDLPEGTPLRLRVIDEIDGSFSEPVAAVVTDGQIVTAPGEGITSLTHLVIVGVD